MKKAVSFTACLIGFTLLLLACNKDDDPEPEKDTRGYNCENYTCNLVEKDAEYMTLTDCKSECADKRPGAVTITYPWTPAPATTYSVTIGVGYSSNDVAIDAYITKATFNISPASLQLANLLPATYYYKVTINSSASTVPVFKAGVFTITPAKTTSITVN
jgi:hypothetical protein